MRRILFLINSNTKNHQIFDEEFVIEYFKQQEAEFELDFFNVEQHGDISKRLDRDLGFTDTVVIVGGSGTKLEAIQYLAYTDIKVAFISTGVADAFSIYVDYPTELKDCLDLIVDDEYSSVDLGLVENDEKSKYFLSYFCAGNTGESVRTTSMRNEEINTLNNYIKDTFKTFLKLKSYKLDVYVSKETYTENFKEVFIGNVSTFGGRYDRYYRSKVSDGMLEVALFYNLNVGIMIYYLFLHLINFGLGFLPMAKKFISTRSCVLNIPEDVPTQIDWEDVQFSGDVQVSCAHKALNLLFTRDLPLV